MDETWDISERSQEWRLKVSRTLRKLRELVHSYITPATPGDVNYARGAIRATINELQRAWGKEI